MSEQYLDYAIEAQNLEADRRDRIKQEDIARGFCRYCGARIPHLYGERRCERCEQHAAEEKKT